MVKMFATVFAFAITGSLAADMPKGDGWMTVSGKALRALVAGKELGDGTHFAYVFTTNGTFSGVEMGKDVQGKWRATTSEICMRWTRPASAEECYVVRQKGREVSFMRDGVEAWSGILQSAQ
jgi:hypothetical protein